MGFTFVLSDIGPPPDRNVVQCLHVWFVLICFLDYLREWADLSLALILGSVGRAHVSTEEFQDWQSSQKTAVAGEDINLNTSPVFRTDLASKSMLT